MFKLSCIGGYLKRIKKQESRNKTRGEEKREVTREAEG
jgi:hypothetical protein